MHRSVKVIAAIALLLAAAFAAGVGVGLRADRNPQVRTVAHTAHAAAASPEEMDAAHEARVKAFAAKTAGLGGQPIQPKIVGGVKVYELTARPVQWEVEPGVTRQAFAYNGQVPGPMIRVTVTRCVPRRHREPLTSKAS